MKKICLLFIGLTVLFTSCGDDPVKFNDTIVEGLDGVVEKMDKVGDFVYESEYDEALLVLDSLKTHLDNYIGIISALNNSSGEEFKHKTLDLLKLVDSEFIPAYKEAIVQYKIADEIEDEDEMNARYDEIYNGLSVIYDKYDVIDKEIDELQKTFAKKNNMDLI